MDTALARWLAATRTRQEDFAAAIGASQSAVSRWAAGERTPTAFWMLRIAKRTKKAVRVEDWSGKRPSLRRLRRPHGNTRAS